MRLKLHDKIFKREHSFTAPTDLDETPIFIVENTSRDYYFPIGVDDVREILSNYPVDRTKFITDVRYYGLQLFRKRGESLGNK